MKKNRLLSLFLALVMLFGVVSALGATAMAADVAINSMNFPDANFRTFVKKYDTNSNGNLSAAELAAVKSMYCFQSNFASLKGIEHFTALKYLDVSYNKLTSLDVSHNTALTRIDCRENKLTSLDVSRHTALTVLWCSGNKLTSLDVSRNTALTELWCGSNKLTSLDVSRNTALTAFRCFNNQLTSLDVSRNTALTSLDCADNKLTSLDVSRNTALTELLCYGNQLTSLNVSAVPAIRDAVVKGTKDGSSPFFDKYKSGQGELYVDRTVTIVTVPALTGTVTISPTNPKTGTTLTANLSGSAASIPASKLHYQWQMYVEVSGRGRYVNINGATKSAYTVTQSAGARIRLSVTADGYDGELYSNAVTVAAGVPTLSGSVSISPANPNIGDTLTANLGGIAASILPSLIHYQWQSLRTNAITGATSFSDISGATGKTYTTSTLASNQYRVKVTADGFDGVLYSDAVKATEGTSSYPKGDVDRSGQVGNSDLIMVARHVVHIITLSGEQFTLGDMDNNKVIDNKDIISVARKVVGL